MLSHASPSIFPPCIYAFGIPAWARFWKVATKGAIHPRPHGRGLPPPLNPDKIKLYDLTTIPVTALTMAQGIQILSLALGIGILMMLLLAFLFVLIEMWLKKAS